MIFNEFVDRYFQNNSTEKGFQKMVVDIYKLREKVPHTKLIPVTIVNERENGTETIEYLVKIAPKNYVLRKIRQYDKMYHREWLVYMMCFPEFEGFEDDRNIEIENRFRAYPYCYAVSLRPYEESMIFEYLEGAKQFQIWDKKIPMDENHIKLVLTEYGKFHAISAALKVHKETLMDYIRTHTSDILMENLTKSQDLDIIEIMCDRLETTDEIQENSNYEEKLRFLKRNIVRLMTDCVENTRMKRNNVLLHGGNNFNDMLFSYKESDGAKIPAEVKFVDWQKASYGPQVFDIASFLYTSLDVTQLSRVDEYLNYYYDIFDRYGSRLGICPQELYHFKAFHEDWQKLSIFALGLSILALYNTFLGKYSESSEKSVNDDPNCNNECLLSPEYVECETMYLRRILDVFKHFVQRGII